MNYISFYTRINWLNRNVSLTTPISARNLNIMDSAISTIDKGLMTLSAEQRAFNVMKADKTLLNSMLVDFEIDDKTGIVTLTRYDGGTIKVNTTLNKIAVNFSYDTVEQKLYITEIDGTVKEVDLSDLIKQYEFLDSDTVIFEVTQDGKVKAHIKEIEIMVGATDTSDGASGTVPAPLVSDKFKFIRGDGTWADAGTALSYDENTSKLQLMNGETVISEVEIQGGGGGVAPKNVTELDVISGNRSLTISWSDPQDTIIDDIVLSKWKGTKLVQKVGSFPESPSDGTVLLDNRVKDKYKRYGFVVSNLTPGETYYFSLFPYSETGAVNKDTSNRISGTPQSYRIMTVVVDLSNSNPSTCITYDDEAADMEVGSDLWDNFFGHYPVLLKNGVEVGKLNPNNFTQFEDGSPADITSGNAGDVMVAFPRMGVKISTRGNILTISMTDEPDNPDFTYYAHTRGTKRKEVFYLGAYKGYVAGSKLRSLSGKTPTTSQKIGTFRTQAHTNGTGYEQSGFYQLTFIQCMYLLKYKNLDARSAIGQGYVGSSTVTNTGATNAKGMDYGTTSDTTQVKLFGIEDFWGNIYEWIDGIVTDSLGYILTATDNFNDSGSGYENQGQGATSGIGDYMSKPQGKSETGFLAKEVNGSQSTYFCSIASLYASCVAFFGGFYSYDTGAGAFSLRVNYGASMLIYLIGARLMYL